MSTILPSSKEVLAEPVLRGTVAERTAPARAPAASSWARTWQRWIVPLIVPALLVAAWQGAVDAKILNSTLVPPPSVVFSTLWHDTKDGILPNDARVSVVRWALGFGLGGGLGLLLGSVVGISRRAELLFDSSLQMARTIPVLGLLPLLVLWLGLGETPKIALVGVASFFPIYINTMAGIRGVDSRLIEVGQVHGLGTVELLRRVVLPAALPQIFTGIRYSLGVAWLSLIVAELLGASSGLGYYIDEGESLSRVEMVMAGLLIFAVMGKLVDVLVRLVERRVLKFRSIGYVADA